MSFHGRASETASQRRPCRCSSHGPRARQMHVKRIQLLFDC
jgi:hypothetical protein